MDKKRSDEKIKDIDNHYIIRTSDTPKIEYIGLWNMLDVLINKVKKTDDSCEIKLYCELYEKLYKLLESKGE